MNINKYLWILMNTYKYLWIRMSYNVGRTGTKEVTFYSSVQVVRGLSTELQTDSHIFSRLYAGQTDSRMLLVACQDMASTSNVSAQSTMHGTAGRPRNGTGERDRSHRPWLASYGVDLIASLYLRWFLIHNTLLDNYDSTIGSYSTQMCQKPGSEYPESLLYC